MIETLLYGLEEEINLAISDYAPKGIHSHFAAELDPSVNQRFKGKILDKSWLKNIIIKPDYVEDCKYHKEKSVSKTKIDFAQNVWLKFFGCICLVSAVRVNAKAGFLI